MNHLTQSQIGPYFVEKELHTRAGMSHICLARHVARPEHQVIIKINASGRKEKRNNPYQDTLTREGNLLPNLHHPGIVRILPTYDGDNQAVYVARAAEADGTPWYYAMEYIEGGSLTEYLKKFSEPDAFPLPWVLELFYQVLVTIFHLHHFGAKGYAHCDIKPDNILLRRRPTRHEQPLPVLVDFGCAVDLSEGNYVRNCFTEEYAPPELEDEIKAANRDNRPATHDDPRAIDIWSLGVTLFELVTGRSFSGNGEPFRTAVRDGKIDKMHEERPDVPVELDLILQRTLVREPENRLRIDQLIAWVEVLLGENNMHLRPPRITSSPRRRWPFG